MSNTDTMYALMRDVGELKGRIQALESRLNAGPPIEGMGGFSGATSSGGEDMARMVGLLRKAMKDDLDLDSLLDEALKAG